MPTPLPTLIWGLLSQASRRGLGVVFCIRRPWRRAEPYTAQRAATVDEYRDWLPVIYAAHCITSYPVGPRWPIPTFRMLAARKPRGWDPSTKAACWPKGGTVTIHPALTAASAATLTRSLKSLRLRGLEHRTRGHKAGCEEAPKRHDQFARQRHNGDALDPFAGIERALPEPLGERAVGLMTQP